MNGARAYVVALRCAAGNKYKNFKKIPYIDAIQNQNFIFVLGEHARGKTLDVYLLKNIDEDELKHNFYNQIKSENSLQVYGPVGGQLGWTEYYDFLVDGKIREELQTVLNDALSFYAKVINKKEERKRKEEELKKLAFKAKVKEFENFLSEKNQLNATTASTNTESICDTCLHQKVCNAYKRTVSFDIREDDDICFCYDKI